MGYKVFRDNEKLPLVERDNHLKKIVSDVLDKIIRDCSNGESNYVYRKDKNFPSVKEMITIMDDNLLKKEVFREVQERARVAGSDIQLQVSGGGKEVVKTSSSIKSDYRNVNNTVLSMKSRILELCNELKEGAINKFDLSNIEQQNEESIRGPLIQRITESLKHHDYKILTAKEKVESKMKFLTGEYPEYAIKDFVKDIYRKDLEEQVKCAESMYGGKINEYKNAVHSDYKDLVNYTTDDIHGQARDYGIEFTKEGKLMLAMKKEFTEQVLSNFDMNFEIFYASVNKSIQPHIKDTSKLSMMDKFKSIAFQGNIDIESIINKNEEQNIKDETIKKNRNTLKI